MLMTRQYKHIYRFVNKSPCLNIYNCACMVGLMKYGQRLKTARLHAGMTQQQLADRIGNAMTQANISYLENSDATGSEFTVQIANACGIRPMWLAEEQGDMVDGYVVEDQRLVHLVKECEALPSYAVDQLVQQGDAMAKLVAEGGRN